MNSLLQNVSYQSECILSTVPLFCWETQENEKRSQLRELVMDQDLNRLSSE